MIIQASDSSWVYVVKEHEKDADVFFVCPSNTSNENYMMNFEDEKSRTKFAGAVNMEKGIYDDLADFYAPYYRQVTIEGYNELDEDEREIYLKAAYKDVSSAFKYYLDNYNTGRPIILAGFSQGADHVIRLLKEYNLSDRLIAAYVIGWHVDKEDIKKYKALKMAKGENDLGVIVSFCSESEDITSSVIVPSKTLGINPLNWKTNTAVALKETNKGACFTSYDGSISSEAIALCGAYIDKERGTLKVTDISKEDYPCRLAFLDEGNYHIYDYQFFYRNLEENVQKRINIYMKTRRKND